MDVSGEIDGGIYRKKSRRKNANSEKTGLLVNQRNRKGVGPEQLNVTGCNRKSKGGCGIFRDGSRIPTGALGDSGGVVQKIGGKIGYRKESE